MIRYNSKSYQYNFEGSNTIRKEITIHYSIKTLQKNIDFDTYTNKCYNSW